MHDTNPSAWMDDDFDHNGYTAELVAAEEAYFRSLPVPPAPEVSDATLDAWERRYDSTL